MIDIYLKKRYVCGITLVELLITMTVLVLVVAIGAPSYSRFTHNSMLLNSANDFAAALNLARSHALKTRRDVRMCPSSDNSSCNNSAAWSSGWIMFVDADDSGNPSASEIIRIGNPMDSRVILSAPGAFSGYVEYKPTGVPMGNGGNSGQFTMCSEKYEELSRLVNISAGGRVSAKKQAGLCAG